MSTKRRSELEGKGQRGTRSRAAHETRVGDDDDALVCEGPSAARQVVYPGDGDGIPATLLAPTPQSRPFAGERSRLRVRRSGRYPAPPLILIVDDNDDLRGLYAEYLRHAGFRTETAENGLIGCEKARARSPAIVLLDYEMPVMNGLEAARQLRDDPGTRDALLIMLSSHVQLPDHGCDRYLVKPCLPETVAATVLAMFDGRAARAVR